MNARFEVIIWGLDFRLASCPARLCGLKLRSSFLCKASGHAPGAFSMEREFLRKGIGRSVRCACVGFERSSSFLCKASGATTGSFCSMLELARASYEMHRGAWRGCLCCFEWISEFFVADLGRVEDWIRNAWKSKGDA